jgi:uncharacterized SAM-binding protein YcdF (DUF218 family)
VAQRPDSDDLTPSGIGPEGVAMLGLSGVVMLLSFGTSLLLALGHVVWVALRTPSDGPPAAHIIVLGMQLTRNGGLSACYRTRLARAAESWRRSERTTIVILGGMTASRSRSEAAAGAAWLLANGVSANSILTEDRSRNTLENLLQYRERYACGCEEPPVLLTSRFHLARSSLLATGLGIAHRPRAAEASRLAALRHLPRIIHEALLIHWYMTSRCFVRLTHNRRVAARIS